jgi:hypothetical protein
MRLRCWGISATFVLALGALGCEQDTTPPHGASGAGGGPPVPLTCDDVNPGAAPLRPLTRFQYDNAMRDLLGDTSAPAQAFPPENEVDGYRTYASANLANPLLVESYLTAAESVAARAVTERLETVAPCDGADEAACGHDFVGSLVERAFRRPLTESELAPLISLFDAGHATSYAKGVELVLQAVLQSPQFLYRVDGLRGVTFETGAIALGGYELASRLAFSLWGSVPDAELMTAAREGRLVTAADVEREARRLLEDERSADIVRDFSEQWLGLSRLPGAVREGADDVEPAVLSAAWRQSLDRYIHDSYFGENGSFQQLFASPSVWMNGTLSPLYGGTATGSAFEPQTMPDPRAGLLTQPALMALLSHSDQTAPVLRGAFVRERFLCQPVPPPPPEVNAVPPDPDPSATTRERFRQHTEQDACSGCHKLIDGVGFGFERYDQLGRYRAEENGLPVDESGEVVGIVEESMNGPFAGAVELSERIAQSTQARSCLAANWYRYTFGRQELPEDVCSVAQVQERFEKAEGNLKELLVALTQTDAFLYRPAIAEVAP